MYIVHYSRVGENIIDYIFLLLPTSNNDAVMGTIFFIFLIKGLEAPFSVQGGFYTLCSIVQYFTLSLFRFRINVIRIRIQDFANLDPDADPNENKKL